MPIDFKNWKIPANIMLAELFFNTPRKENMLLGAQLFLKILRMDQLTHKGSYPVLQNTELGWILTGE